MRAKLRQRWYRLRDRFRDRVWEFAGRIDPAVAQANTERMLAFDELTRYVGQDLGSGERGLFMLCASPAEVVERALDKAAREGFEAPLVQAIRPAPWGRA